MQLAQRSAKGTSADSAVFDLKELHVSISAGDDFRIRVQFLHSGDNPNFEQYSLKFDNRDVIQDLEVIECLPSASGAGQRDWLLARKLAGELPGAAALTLYQRKDEEPVIEFVNRWLSPLKLPAPDAFVGRPADLERVFPVGGCLLQPADGDIDYRIALIQARGGEQSPTYAGLFEAPKNGWGWYAHCPGTTDVNHFCVLNPEAWEPAAAPAPARADRFRQVRWVTRTIRIAPNEQAGWLSALIGGEPQALADDATNKAATPFRPMTVRWGEDGPDLFCHSLEFMFTFNIAESEPNTQIFLGLSCCRQHIGAIGTRGDTTLILAEFQRWLGAGQPFLALVSPLTDAAGALPGFPRWQMQAGNSEGLTAAMLAPGFVRPGYSAFSALMKNKDLVVVQVQGGQLPVILGSLQRFRDGQKDDLLLSAEKLAISAVKPDGADAQTSLSLSNDGKAKVAAVESLQLGETVLVKSAELSISSDTKIGGKLDVA